MEVLSVRARERARDERGTKRDAAARRDVPRELELCLFLSSGRYAYFGMYIQYVSLPGFVYGAIGWSFSDRLVSRRFCVPSCVVIIVVGLGDASVGECLSITSSQRR